MGSPTIISADRQTILLDHWAGTNNRRARLLIRRSRLTSTLLQTDVTHDVKLLMNVKCVCVFEVFFSILVVAVGGIISLPCSFQIVVISYLILEWDISLGDLYSSFSRLVNNLTLLNPAGVGVPTPSLTLYFP